MIDYIKNVLCPDGCQILNRVSVNSDYRYCTVMKELDKLLEEIEDLRIESSEVDNYHALAYSIYISEAELPRALAATPPDDWKKLQTIPNQYGDAWIVHVTMFNRKGPSCVGITYSLGG